jgi:uncharacterized protein DUF4381
LNPDPLAQLRDIHLPEPVGWWPPAPGWWIIALLLFLLILFATKYLIARHRQRQFRRQAKSLLTQCWETYQQKADDHQFLETLFTIMRRVYLSRNTLSRKALSGKTAVSNQAAHDIKSEQQSQLETITTEHLFGMLDTSLGGELSRCVSQTDIDSLLYQKNPQPLQKEQTERLYAAANKWLKRGAKQC